MSTNMHQNAPERCVDCAKQLGVCTCQCSDCGMLRADWQPRCEIDAYGTHHWISTDTGEE